MKAHPILMQKKYARIVECLAEKKHWSPEDALDFFYHSETYRLISTGVSDMHCMSDMYLADELVEEFDRICEKRK